MNAGQLTQIYRRLVLVSAASWLAGTILPYVEHTLWPFDVNELLSRAGEAAIMPMPELLFLALGLFGLWARGSMWFFHPFARVGLLAVVISAVPLCLLGGVGVSSPIGSTISYLGCLSDGAVLALAYFSPLRRQFVIVAAKLKAEENETP